MSESSTDKQHLQDEIVKLQEKRKTHEAEKASGKGICGRFIQPKADS